MNEFDEFGFEVGLDEFMDTIRLPPGRRWARAVRLATVAVCAAGAVVLVMRLLVS
jgi:hypothetical protein